MDYLELKSMVTGGKKKAYFLYAQDEQLIFEVRDILRKKVLKNVDSLSHFKLDGNKCTPEDLEIALSTYSMFNEDILVEISNCYFMEGSTNPLRVLVEEYLKDPREDLYFFGSYKYENDLSKKNFYLDNLKKKISALSIIESIDSLKPRGVVTIIEERFAASNIDAGKNIPVFISEVFKGSTLQLEKELDKLMAYTMGREIKKEDVLKIMTISDERHVMNLLDMMFTERGIGRNIKDILNLVNDLVYRGEKSEMIIALIGSRVRLLFKIKALKEEKAGTQEIMKHLKTGSAWYADRMSKIADAISFNEYNRLFEVLLSHEYTLKTTSVGTMSLLEMLVLSIVNSRDI